LRAQSECVYIFVRVRYGGGVNESIQLLVGAIIAYLLGAIPVGLLVARAKGVDIRSVGSGNIGATNVFRSIGKPWGVATFVLDALKGFVPAWVFPLWCADPGWSIGLLFGCMAIAGHNWPVYLGFKGGKGVATSAGVLLGVAPVEALIGAGVWFAVFFVSRYVSLASIAAAVAIPAAGWLRAEAHGPVLPVVLTLLGILAVWRHRSNIERLSNGTENRFERKKNKGESS
jgi:acyl phosphate:glycerol-3-phosphate acyltransferase